MALDERALAKEFEQNGVIRVRGAFDAAWVEDLRRGVEVALGAGQTLKAGAAGEEFNIKSDLAACDPVFRKVVFDSPAVEIARAVTQSSVLHHYVSTLFVKEPGSANSASPWHQDQPYFDFDGWQNCSIWIAMDSVTAETGGVTYVAGSHRWGKWYRPIGFGSQYGEIQSEFEEQVPDIDAGGYDLLCYELEPGDCLVHHGLVVHGARGNSSNTRRRRGLSIRYTGDDCRYRYRGISARIPRAPIADGAPMECGRFPRVFPPAA